MRNVAAAFAFALPWTFHFQATTITQGHGDFQAPYSGLRSLQSNQEVKTSLTSTIFAGIEPIRGTELYLNPEIAGGQGLSGVQGIAGFPNGEIERVSSPAVKPYVSRLFVRQTVNFGGGTEHVDEGLNQVMHDVAISRLTLTFGRFSLTDMFDGNAYSHEPRTQFMNWALFDNGAWDFAADVRGYTWGFSAELNQRSWVARYAIAMEPTVANGPYLDTNIGRAQGHNIELEYRYSLAEQQGRARLMSFINQAHMGLYDTAGSDITSNRAYRVKYGFGLNFEQQISGVLGAFSRLGWDDGKTETWTFTEIDRTASVGLNLTGEYWKREADHLGAAWVVNGLSSEHRAYLERGGYGYLVGDGALNYAPEQIAEVFYSATLYQLLSLSLDFQYVWNPAYNADRGPVAVYSGRAHFEF